MQGFGCPEANCLFICTSARDMAITQGKMFFCGTLTCPEGKPSQETWNFLHNILLNLKAARKEVAAANINILLVPHRTAVQTRLKDSRC